MRSLYAFCSFSSTPVAFCLRLLKAAGLKGSLSEGVPAGKRADSTSRVRKSSLRFAGTWMVFDGVFGEEKKLVSRDAALVFFTGVTFALEIDSIAGSVGLFFSFPLSGLVSRILDMFGWNVSSGMPNCTGAEDPVNHEASPFDLSATFITPSLSPVNVGMKSSTSCFGLCCGLFRSGLFELVLVGDRKGNKDVSDRWWVREGLAGDDLSSCSKERVPGKGCDAGGGLPALSRSPWFVYSPSLE